MNEVPCSQCKHRDLEPKQFPCCMCKGTASPNSYEYWAWLNFFDPDTKSTEASPDPVSHPAHYAGKYECIDVMVDVFGPEYVQAFCLCNAFKYLYRCMKKYEAPVEDIEKAEWYLTKFLKLESVADDE